MIRLGDHWTIVLDGAGGLDGTKVSVAVTSFSGKYVGAGENTDVGIELSVSVAVKLGGVESVEKMADE
jgi:hypothetical protein